MNAASLLDWKQTIGGKVSHLFSVRNANHARSDCGMIERDAHMLCSSSPAIPRCRLCAQRAAASVYANVE
jgi:hypothetical protein